MVAEHFTAERMACALPSRSSTPWLEAEQLVCAWLTESSMLLLVAEHHALQAAGVRFAHRIKHAPAGG